MDEKEKRTLLKVLKMLGITKATIEFNGGGDSGQVETVEAEGLSDKSLTHFAVPDEAKHLAPAGHHPDQNNMAAFLMDLAYDLIEESGYDWVNNEGGFGTLTIVPGRDSIHLDMHINVMSTDDYEFQLGFEEEHHPVTLSPEKDTPEVTNG